MKNLGLVFLVVASVFIGLAFLNQIPTELESFVKQTGIMADVSQYADKRQSNFTILGLTGVAFAAVGCILIVISNEKSNKKTN